MNGNHTTNFNTGDDGQWPSAIRSRHLRAMQSLLKPFAFACKILAVSVWLGIACLKIGMDISEMHATSPPRDAPHDWGTPAYFHRTYLEIGVVSVVALLSVIPNRRLVASPLAFGLSLFVALLPFCALVHDWSDPFMTLGNYIDPFVLVLLFVFGALPLSLTCSFWRHRKGEAVTYA